MTPNFRRTDVQCQTLNEEEIFEVQDRLSLFPLGWIHVSVNCYSVIFIMTVTLADFYGFLPFIMSPLLCLEALSILQVLLDVVRLYVQYIYLF